MNLENLMVFAPIPCNFLNRISKIKQNLSYYSLCIEVNIIDFRNTIGNKNMLYILKEYQIDKI